MYVNKRRIKAEEAVTLRNKDSICFGCNVPNNELLYTFQLNEGKALLKRACEVKNILSPSKPGSSITPPLAKPAKVSHIQRQQQLPARKRLKLDSNFKINTLDPTPPLPGASSAPPSANVVSPGVSSSQPATESQVKKHACNSPIKTSSVKAQTGPSSLILPVESSLPTEPHSTVVSSQLTCKPSPEPSSTTSAVEPDDLLDDILSKSDDTILDSLRSDSSSSPVKRCHSPESTTPNASQDFIAGAPLLGADSLSPLNVSSPQVVPSQSTSLLLSPPCVVPSSSAGHHQVTSQNSPVALPSADSLPSPLVVRSKHTKPLEVSSSVKPSPALSAASTKTVEVDDLFDDIISQSGETLLDEAIFSDTSRANTNAITTTTPDLGRGHMDGATIQVMAAQEKAEEEKHKLLSSIEALKSELAAKNEWITKQEQDQKKSAEEEGIVSSMTEEFTCVICQELFIKAHTLPCSHSFCEVCIKEWLRTKKVCPICRKRVTTGPVHSLVLDNAIIKIEEKLSGESKQEREAVKKDRTKSSGSGGAAVCSVTRTASSSHSSSSHHVTVHVPEVIVLDTPPRRPTVSSGTVLLDSSVDDDSSSSDSEDEDTGSTYRGYGGYGKCYHCGE